MRFGQTLKQAIYPPWSDKYIDYSKLKKLLKEDDSAPSSPDRQTKQEWTEQDEGDFVEELVNVQLEKVHAFHKETYEKLRDRTAKCEAKLDPVVISTNGSKDEDKETKQPETNGKGSSNGNGNGKKPMPSEAEKSKVMKEVLDELDEITKETNELEKYSRINYAGFLKAVKKHDRKRGQSYRVRPLLQVRLAALPFNKEDYSPLLYRLSAMYSFIRQRLEGTGDRGMSMSMSESQMGREEYHSYKFWVHPENLLEVKTVILRRLPVLVYNPQTSKIAEGGQPDPTITSIYFDNPAFSLYTNKVDHSGDASSCRLRWYGQLSEKPEIYFEKKTVTEDDTSKEQRFSIKDKHVQPFTKGEYKMEKQIKKLADRAGENSTEVENFKSAVEELQSFIRENDLQPVVRANYTRTAFQIPGDDRVRISLDTDLAFIREDAIDVDRPCRDPETWHRTDIDSTEMEYPFTSIRKGEISRFPFALLEIKVRTSQKEYEWVADLMSSHLVKEAPRFSKFVHGVSTLFEDYVNTFPFWLSEMETDIRRDPHEAFEEEQAKKQKERDDEFAVGSLLKTPSGRGPGKRPSQASMLSPVGSPNLAGSLHRSPQPKSSSPETTRKSNLAQATEADHTGMENVVEEPDSDDDGQQGHGTFDRSRGGLSSLFPSFSTSKYAKSRRARAQLPPGVVEPKNWIKDQGPVKVEAKVWLANQRTFIKWQHVSVLLASLSLGLYNAAGKDNTVARVLAVVYTLVAVFTGIWGWGIYLWRSNLIEKRSGKDFDAMTGPIVVCVGLAAALILNFAFKYRIALEEREDGASAELFNKTAEYFIGTGEL